MKREKERLRPMCSTNNTSYNKELKNGKVNHHQHNVAQLILQNKVIHVTFNSKI